MGPNCNQTEGSPKTASHPRDPAVHRRRVITSAELLGDEREICIVHAGEVYVLHRTSRGKLILTK